MATKTQLLDYSEHCHHKFSVISDGKKKVFRMKINQHLVFYKFQ